tara:strand:+ start:70 stop:213 length:144 start_codon:yes stop_codon:yes gene_type:complete
MVQMAVPFMEVYTQQLGILRFIQGDMEDSQESPGGGFDSTVKDFTKV